MLLATLKRWSLSGNFGTGIWHTVNMLQSVNSRGYRGKITERINNSERAPATVGAQGGNVRDENASKKVAFIGNPEAAGLMDRLNMSNGGPLGILSLVNSMGRMMPFYSKPPSNLRGTSFTMPSNTGGFKQNQRKQRATSRRKAMRASAR